jgi:hypothetical protein
MPIGHSGYYIPSAWLVWLMFFALTLVAALYVQVLHWESQFEINKNNWLGQMRSGAKQVRAAKLRLARLPALPDIEAPLTWIRPLFRGISGFLFPFLKIALMARLKRLI